MTEYKTYYCVKCEQDTAHTLEGDCSCCLDDAGRKTPGLRENSTLATEPTNTSRADKAAKLFEVEPYNAPENDIDSNLSDMLTDLMHYCRREEISFESAHNMAEDHFDAELDAEFEALRLAAEAKKKKKLDIKSNELDMSIEE